MNSPAPILANCPRCPQRPLLVLTLRSERKQCGGPCHIQRCAGSASRCGCYLECVDRDWRLASHSTSRNLHCTSPPSVHITSQAPAPCVCPLPSILSAPLTSPRRVPCSPSSLVHSFSTGTARICGRDHGDLRLPCKLGLKFSWLFFYANWRCSCMWSCKEKEDDGQAGEKENPRLDPVSAPPPNLGC